jgi:hypothetical protein
MVLVKLRPKSYWLVAVVQEVFVMQVVVVLVELFTKTHLQSVVVLTL